MEYFDWYLDKNAQKGPQNSQKLPNFPNIYLNGNFSYTTPNEATKLWKVASAR